MKEETKVRKKEGREAGTKEQAKEKERSVKEIKKKGKQIKTE